MTPEAYIREARRIIRLVQDEFVLPDGSLFLEKNGDIIRPFHIFPDLGDVAPFFLYFGEGAFIDRQVELYRKTLQDGLLVSQFPSLGISGLVKSYEYTDLLLGLLAHLQAAPEDNARKERLDEAVRAVRGCFLGNGVLRSLYHSKLHMPLPVIDTRDSTLAECFVDIYEYTKDESYLADADQIIRALLRTPFYTAYGLFADYEPAGPLSALLLAKSGKSAGATLCKNTTNTLFALLSYHRVRPGAGMDREIARILDALDAHATAEGGALIERFVPGRERKGAYLTASFPLIDFLCDLSRSVPSLAQRSIRKARAIAEYWMSRQGATGLFPLHGDGKSSFLDSETDMVVALMKLTEVTGEATYAKAAERCLAGIIAAHGAHDYVLSVDVDSGAVIDAAQRTKFLCLFLKVLILKLEQGQGKRIYGTPSLFELLKDR